jgi:lipopolysaccharide transport system permease protein
VPSAFAGMILWQLFTRGVSEGATSLTANSSLITKVYFPRIVLPLAAVLSALFDVLISLVLLAVVLVWFKVPVQLPMLLAPLFIIQIAFTVFAFSIWLSAIDGMFRDLRHALPLILQLGMFISPVAYTTAAIIPEKWTWLYEYNPLVGPLEGFRWTLLQGAPVVNGSAEIKSLLITAVLFVTGLLFFARMERTIVDRV